MVGTHCSYLEQAFTANRLLGFWTRGYRYIFLSTVLVPCIGYLLCRLCLPVIYYPSVDTASCIAPVCILLLRWPRPTVYEMIAYVNRISFVHSCFLGPVYYCVFTPGQGVS